MAAIPGFRVRKNSPIHKETSKSRSARLNSIFGPSTSTTETENIYQPMVLDNGDGIQTTGTTPTTSSIKISTTNDPRRFATTNNALSNFQNQIWAELEGQPANPVNEVQAYTQQPTGGQEQTINLISAFNISCNSNTTSRAGSLFLNRLHHDIRFMIYNHLVDSEHEVIISPGRKYHSHILALATTCTRNRDEIEAWANRRMRSVKQPTLTFNPTFGLLNLALTTFKLSWSTISTETGELEKYQRCYSPEVVEIYLPNLELYQRAMTLAESSRAAHINREICENDQLANVGPAIKNDRWPWKHGTRVLSLNNHNNFSLEKYNLQAKDFRVFDPRKHAGNAQVPEAYKRFYHHAPYVWSKDWEMHEEHQEYCFKHPSLEGEKG